MWKLIFLGLIFWLVVYILKRTLQATDNRQSKDKASSSKSNGESEEHMVQCVSCEVHVPRSEAYLVNGNFYCCKAHIKNK